MENPENTAPAISKAAPVTAEHDQQVMEAMITSDSKTIANRFRDSAYLRRKPGEHHYVVRYYVHENSALDVSPYFFYAKRGARSVIPEATRQFNTVNTQMHAAIQSVMRNIGQQLQGRLVFESTHAPKDADIQFVAVPELFRYARHKDGSFILDDEGKKVKDVYDGVTLPTLGVIILSEDKFSGSYTSDMEQTVTHEMGHALGLEHPHNDSIFLDRRSVSGTSYYKTAMTNGAENQETTAGVEVLASGYPLAFQPLDIKLLQQLYPLPEDAVTPPKTGALTEVYADGLLKAELRANDGKTTPILFPDRGIALQPVMVEPTHTLHIGGGVKPLGNAHFAQRNHDDAVVFPHAHIRLMPDGTAITQPYGRGSTYIPEKVRTLELSPDMPVWARIDSGSVRLPLNRPDEIIPNEYNQHLEFTSGHNQLTLDAREMDGRNSLLVSVHHGATLHVHVENAQELLKIKRPSTRSLFSFNLDTSGQDGATAIIGWSKNAKGQYLLSATPRDSDKFNPTFISVTLDDADPRIHRQFELALATELYVRGRISSSITSDDGVRTLRPAIDVSTQKSTRER